MFLMQAADSFTDVLHEGESVVTLWYGSLIAQGTQDKQPQ